MAKLIKLYDNTPDADKVREIINCLRDGGVIIYPTDSVYSLGCSLLKTKALEKVAKLKGIKPEKAKFSMICKDISDISTYVKSLDNQTFRLLKASLPGPFTFILEASTEVPKLFKAKRKEIGIRVPDNTILQHIIAELGNPLIGTSVHDEDEILDYTTNPEDIFERYQHDVDIVIDGGFSNNIPTTVVDCTVSPPEVLREGLGELNI